MSWDLWRVSHLAQENFQPYLPFPFSFRAWNLSIEVLYVVRKLRPDHILSKKKLQNAFFPTSYQTKSAWYIMYDVWNTNSNQIHWIFFKIFYCIYFFQFHHCPHQYKGLFNPALPSSELRAGQWLSGLWLSGL